MGGGTSDEEHVENSTDPVGREWKSSRWGILRLRWWLRPPPPSSCGEEPMPSLTPQPCLRLLFTAADVIAAHRCGRRTKRRRREGRVLICEDCEGVIIIIIIVILHTVEFSFSGRNKNRTCSRGVTDWGGVAATALATPGNRSFM